LSWHVLLLGEELAPLTLPDKVIRKVTIGVENYLVLKSPWACKAFP
jgi:hypothetical protein